MEFRKGSNTYTVIRTNDTDSDNIPIFKWCAWTIGGQMTDTGEISATCIEHVKNKILEM